VKGLPGPLPEGERLLWQGAPRAWPFVRQIFHANLLVGYVGILLGWCLITGARSGQMEQSILAVAQFGGLSLVAFALLAGFAVLQARGTTYTITSARVVIDYGVAFEKAVNIPFAAVDQAGLRMHGDGTGDLVLVPRRDQTIHRLLLWPHVRPWHFGRTEPALRALADAEKAASILGRALAASAGVNPVALSASAASQGSEEVVATA
jgi:hypothetical protein